MFIYNCYIFDGLINVHLAHRLLIEYHLMEHADIQRSRGIAGFSVRFLWLPSLKKVFTKRKTVPEIGITVKLMNMQIVKEMDTIIVIQSEW